MSTLRFYAIKETFNRKPVAVNEPERRSSIFGKNVFNESLFEYPSLHALWKNKALYGPLKLPSVYHSDFLFCIEEQHDLKIRKIRGERWCYNGQTKLKPKFNPIYMRISEF